MMWLAALIVCAPAHGSWVYKRSGLDDKRMLTLTRARGILTEVYVSLGALPLDDAATPAKIKRLKASGLRIEALIDDPKPGALIGKVLAYNRAQRDASTRFDGIHYDFEPWIGTGADTAWVGQLLASYAAASAALAGSPLTFSADISGAKIFSLPREDQAKLQQAVPRMVLMQYEAKPERVAARSRPLLSDGKSASVMIALRHKDFGCGVIDQLKRIESDGTGSQTYGGWAVFEYEDYASKCPDQGLSGN